MSEHVRKSCVRLATFVALALFGTTVDAAPMSIRQLAAQQLRLSSIDYRMAAANVRLCARPQMLSGLVLHDLTEYRPGARAAVSSAFSLRDGIGVLQVVRGSPADRAGLQVDDEILAINGVSVEDAHAVATAGQSYDRLSRFSGLLAAGLSSAPVDLLLRRHGNLINVTLRGQPGCGGEALVIVSSDVNAWSDGSHVFVSTAMMRLAPTDDQLAFVVAHEMAHNILGHSSAGDAHGLLALFGFGATKVRREETEADEFAVPLMSAGGYAPTSAIQLLQNVARCRWWDVSLDHPGFGERIRTVSAVIARMSPART